MVFVSGARVLGSRAKFYFIRRTFGGHAALYWLQPQSPFWEPQARARKRRRLRVVGRTILGSRVVSVRLGLNPTASVPQALRCKFSVTSVKNSSWSNDCSSPRDIVNCTVNVQDMCQKEVMEQSAGKRLGALLLPSSLRLGGEEVRGHCITGED